MPNAAIRLAEARDAAAIAAIYAPNVTAAIISFEIVAPGADEFAERIASTLRTHPWLVCENADGKILGYVYASQHRARAAYCWSVDVTAYIDAESRRRGVGRALYTSLFELLRLQGFYRAYAGVTLPNPGSVGLHEAMGFQLVGIYNAVGHKLGAWRDVGWWELALRELSAAPAPPLDVPAASADPRWQGALEAGLPLLRP